MAGRPGSSNKDEKLIQRVALWSKRGYTVREIADKVGVSYPTVWRILKKPGYAKVKKERAKGAGRPPIFTEAQKRVLDRMIRAELRAQLKGLVKKL